MRRTSLRIARPSIVRSGVRVALRTRPELQQLYPQLKAKSPRISSCLVGASHQGAVAADMAVPARLFLI